jgi:hypothetical protein
VTDTKPNAVATGSWTLEEDTKLTSAVTNTRKKKHGKEYRINRVAVAKVVPGRTRKQCKRRWQYTLDPSIDLASGHRGKWAEDEVSKLRDAIKTHGAKNWVTVATLVPGRTKQQCRDRWKDALDPSIDRANGSTGKWAEDEDSKLKDAVQTHSGKNWDAIAALVQGRTKKQCYRRWHRVLKPSIRLSGHKGTWTAVEDMKLKSALQTHGGRYWSAIAPLVPGRTQKQCRDRCMYALDPEIDGVSGKIDRVSGSTGRWAEDEDMKLKDAVQTHGDKDWVAISALVPGRTKIQCCNRWHDVLNPHIDGANRSRGRWAENEDIKLKDAVQTHGCKNWDAIAALVPGRTRTQCLHRWYYTLDSNIGRVNGRTGKWSRDEDIKLKGAIQTYGDRDWVAISALVQGRTNNQCSRRWKAILNPSIDRANRITGK